MTYEVFVEETRTRDVEVEAESWEEAFEIVEKMYKSGDICMSEGGVAVQAQLGSEEHQFFPVCEWYF